MKPAAFLDRDGVICKYVHHLHRVEDFELLPQAGQAIKALNEAGYLVFVMTNQPMIAKGILTPAILEDIHAKMHRELALLGARLDGVKFCPHSTGGSVAPWNIDCDCRKPKTGMIENYCREFAIDLKNSFVAGDTWRDVQCAKNLGLPNYGICGGAGFPYDATSPHAIVKPDLFVNSLWEAVQHRLGRTSSENNA
jgi:D-glycero-D-manno-heptose 1,7-bisphosphate phosphatase